MSNLFHDIPVKDEASEPLLQAFKAHLPELERLLERANSHWGGEDHFYRFYHQSFKLYSIQLLTLDIAEALSKVQEAVDLHCWFIEILEEGTGHEFQFKDNEDWLKKSRPILDAFFHARTMLEFAVKYGSELGYAPAMMPSGWAALRQLYGRSPQEDAKTNVAELVERKRAIQPSGEKESLFSFEESSETENASPK